MTRAEKLKESWQKALLRYKSVSDEITPQLEASLTSVLSNDLNNQEPKDLKFAYREAIFAWTLYQYRNRTLTFEEFLPIYDGINKDIPTSKEIIQGFSNLI